MWDLMLQYVASNYLPCYSEVFGDDVADHSCFTVAVFGFADILPEVDGLHVLDGQDALRHSRRVTCAPLNQPPGSVRMNWALVLQNKSAVYCHNTDS